MHQHRPSLTTEQIARLFDFCKEHYVSHYDLQVEIVDHMAAAIEDRLPELSFEEALDRVFKGFGYKGFAGIVESRKKQLQAANLRQGWGLFLDYFTWPKAMLTALVMTLLFVLQYYFPPGILKYFTVGALGVLILVELALKGRQWLRYTRPSAPLLLLNLNWPFPLVSIAAANLYVNVLHGLRWLDGSKPFTLLAYDGFIIAFALTLGATLAGYDMKKQVYYKARRQYPDLFPSSIP